MFVCWIKIVTVKQKCRNEGGGWKEEGVEERAHSLCKAGTAIAGGVASRKLFSGGLVIMNRAGRKNRARSKRIKDTINIYYLYNCGEMKLMDRGWARSASDNPLAVLRLNHV